MKLILVWLHLLTTTAAFPTESLKTEEEQPCCVGSPKLLYSGYDTQHGINVFLFEFPPLKKKPKAKMENENEDYAAKLGKDTANVPPNSDLGKQPKHVATETNTPAYPQDSYINSDTMGHFTNGTSDDKQKRDSIPSEMSSTPHDDIQRLDSADFDIKSGPRAHARNGHQKEYGTASGQSVPGYISTDSKLNDMPGYNSAKAAKQDFSKEEESLRIDGSCKNSSTDRISIQVFPPAYEKVDSVYQQDSNISSDTVTNFGNSSLIRGGNNFSETNIDAMKPNDPKYDTNSGPKDMTRQKLYGEYGRVQNPDIALGDQAKHTYNEEELIVKAQSATDGYYSTEGITLTDIPGYSDSNVAKQDPNIHFPLKDIDMQGCTVGICENDQVSNSTTQKRESLANNDQVKEGHANKSKGRQEKIVTAEKNKGSKPFGEPTGNKKYVPTKYNTSRGARNYNQHRQRYNSDGLLHHRNHRHSSSESASDSSQEFD